eukprot:TRINITY_DN740_c0_g1_i1.p1 TRINITY_DN740_c0_g1~~TRINITY_DN740_c0_g1_i1.p1  ORF type:complete len:173 (-),score=64.82 TRINITY_DN740_c0_g1_i1:451-969(-)
MEALSEENILEMRAHFDNQDPSGSGYLDAEGMKAAIKELSKKRSSKYKDTDDAEVEDMIRYFSTSGGRRKEISFPEFLFSMGQRVKDTDENDSLKQLFDQFDVNKDGVVITTELRQAMSQLGRNTGVGSWSDSKIDSLIREGDANKDGVLDFEEFKKIMLSPKAAGFISNAN